VAEERDPEAGLCPRCVRQTLRRTGPWSWACSYTTPDRRRKDGRRPCGFACGMSWLYEDYDRLENGQQPRRYTLEVRQLIRARVWEPTEPARLLRLPVRRDADGP
jgi:hypothetical protein